MPFLFFWLFFWTIGVLFIQAITIAEPMTPVLLFAVTHGGAQVAVMRVAARQLLVSTETPPRAPTLELDHDGLRARWARGTGSGGVWAFAALFFGVVHVALVLGVGYSLLAAPPGVAPWLIALAWIAAWGWTGVHTWRDLRTYQTSRGEVAVDADLDGVRVTDRGVTTRLPLEGLELTQVDDRLSLRSKDVMVSVPCKASPEQAELLATLTLMSGRVVEPAPIAVPPELARLRAGSAEG